MNQEIINFDNVSFSYGGQVVIDNATLKANKGDFLAIIGPNGSGKTTLIKLLLGFLTPSKGTITIFKKAPGNITGLQKVGYVPQKATNFDQNFPATVFEVASMALFTKRGIISQPTKKDYSKVEKALELVDMLHLRNKRIGDLSGGQQQRVFIARALATEPEVLILDEPLAGIDMQAQHKFYLLLKALHNKGMTIILVSHDVGIVSKYANKLCCVNVSVAIHDISKGIKHEDLMCAYSNDFTVVPHHHDK